MRCPRLNELPAPPPGKVGWPWTEESRRLPSHDPLSGEWPRISIVTPSYNQGKFIEETIRSILLQGYTNLEYFVLDGGSTDDSVEIIKKYSPWITYWVSERDSGQSDAINRGFRMASGDFATWVNSDDMLCKNALVDHITQKGCVPNTVYVGNCLRIDVSGKIISSHRARVHTLEDLLRIKTIWRARGYIVQPEVLFPRELALAVGGLNVDNHCSMDYELWGKFFLAGARFQYTDIPFGMFRVHPDQKTKQGAKITESLLNTAEKLALRADFSEEKRQGILAELEEYRKSYKKSHWKNSGRLGKIGLPPTLVNSIRGVRAKLSKDER